MTPGQDKLQVLTWHVHGSYLWYLSQAPHDFIVPVKPGRPPGYAGLPPGFPWPSNLREVPAGAARERKFDVVLSQSNENWQRGRDEILSPAQKRLPRIHIEHDPPRQSPTETRHIVDDPDALLVHVTHFNDLMWDSGRTPTRVIEHGVMIPPGVRYSGRLDRGLVVVNSLKRRGRRLGADVFEMVRKRVPLDLIGMESHDAGGLGEVKPPGMVGFAADYRFLFNPIRYTSLGLAVCEAMMAGIPVVGLATTEMATAVENGVSGWVDTDVERLIEVMKHLIQNPQVARQWGEGARKTALARFSIGRFVADWDRTLREAAGKTKMSPASGAGKQRVSARPRSRAEPSAVKTRAGGLS